MAARPEGYEILSSGKRQSGPTRIILTASYQICPIFTTFKSHDTKKIPLSKVMTQILGAQINTLCLMNTQNTIEKIFLKKKRTKKLTRSWSEFPGLQTLYFLVGLNHSVKGVLQGSAAVRARHKVMSERRAM